MRTMTAAALVLGLVGLTGAGLADDKKADPSGTWKWTTEFGGQKRDQTLKLKLEGDKLTGTMSGGRGGKGGKGANAPDTKIEDASFKDGEIKFTVTRERGGTKTVSKYSGKLTGDTIKGTIESDRGGETQKRDWEAKREKVID
jgi:hypothetical protein